MVTALPLRDVILIHVLPPAISAIAVMYVGWLTARSNANKQQVAMTDLHNTVTRQQNGKQ